MAEPDLDVLEAVTKRLYPTLTRAELEWLIAKARRAEALEELVKLLNKTGGKCGAFHAVRLERCTAPIGHHGEHRHPEDDRGRSTFTEGTSNVQSSPWTPDALALLVAVTSDGEVDRG